MGSSTISLGLGLGGGKAATSSGRLAGGGAFVNEYSVSFDGSDDRMTVGTGVNPTGSATLSLWFRRTGTVTGFGGTLIGTNNIFVNGYDNTFSINLKSGTDLTFESYNNRSGSYTNAVAADIINTNIWYHLALVLTFTDSSTSSGQFYLNGNTVGSAIALSGRTLAGMNEGFVVGMYPFNFGAGTYNYPFPGQVDEVSVFNSALSSSNITSIYNSGVPNDISSLSPVGWWRMGDGTEAGSGTTVYDMSSNSNNGTLTNGPTFSTDVPS